MLVNPEALREVVARLDRLGREQMLCCRQPWAEDARCVVVAPTADLTVPEAIRAAGYAYFLDVPTALEVLAVFSDREPTLDERVRLLLFYAEHDAYPEWVYEP